VLHYYTALHRQNIPVDIIGEEDDLSGYKLVIAPLLYMTKPGVDERIREFVKAGGTFVTTCFSGYVDESDRVITGGYPGRLRDILGVWVEESDALPEHKSNRFICENQEYLLKYSVILYIRRERRLWQSIRRIFMREPLW